MEMLVGQGDEKTISLGGLNRMEKITFDRYGLEANCRKGRLRDGPGPDGGGEPEFVVLVADCMETTKGRPLCRPISGPSL